MIKLWESLYCNPRSTKEVSNPPHKNNANFLWMVTPKFCKPFFLGQLEDQILENFSKNFDPILFWVAIQSKNAHTTTKFESCNFSAPNFF
jgi:hypothetical protein